MERHLSPRKIGVVSAREFYDGEPDERKFVQ